MNALFQGVRVHTASKRHRIIRTSNIALLSAFTAPFQTVRKRRFLTFFRDRDGKKGPKRKKIGKKTKKTRKKA